MVAMSYSCLTVVLQMKRTTKRTTWTIEPDEDVASLVSKEMTARVGRNGNRRGLLTKILNELARSGLAHHKGKREINAA